MTTSAPDAAVDKPSKKVRAPRTRWWIGSRIAGVCLLLLIGLILRQPSSWVRLTPGPIFDLQGHVTGDITNHSVTRTGHGHFAILTVSVQRETVLTHVYYDIFGDHGAEMENDPGHQLTASAPVVIPSEGDPAIQMFQSIDTAASLAYSLSTATTLDLSGSLIEVVDVPGSNATAAASAGLVVGDVVTGINGVVISNPELLHQTLVHLWSKHAPITLDVLDGTARSHVALNERLMSHGLMGVLSAQWYANPAKLNTTFTQIGGPSGGLMTTLAFLDALNKGDLAGGRAITGTGEISSNGAISEVGGVAEKMVSAAHEGYRIFFVPKGNLKAAKSIAPKDMTIIPVTTLAQAVTWLCAHGSHSSVCAIAALQTSPVRSVHVRS